MGKTIKQIADELGVSKQAVTKCIDNLGLRSTLTKNGNFFVVDDSQEKAIKQVFLAHQIANQNAKDEQIRTLQGQLTAKDEQIGQITAAMESTAAALTAAQALHAVDKKTLMMIEDKENERKLSFWERRAAKKAEKKARKEQSDE